MDANHKLAATEVAHGNQLAAYIIFVQDAFLELHLTSPRPLSRNIPAVVISFGILGGAAFLPHPLFVYGLEPLLLPSPGTPLPSPGIPLPSPGSQMAPAVTSIRNKIINLAVAVEAQTDEIVILAQNLRRRA